MPRQRALSILMVGSEAVPFAKTGGLADVLSGLPAALVALGHRVTLVLPRYKGMTPDGASVEIPVPIAGAAAPTRFIDRPLGERNSVVLVDRPELYERDALYGTADEDYPDNPLRFGFLSRAALEYARRSTRPFDVLHAHDWQAGLAPVYLRRLYADDPHLHAMASVLTIHNLAYQGIFPSETMPTLDLPWDLFTLDGLEYWGGMSFLKGGIKFSDVITTVSPTHAKEIQTNEYGFGFEDILARRADDLYGILNGIDTDRWNPSKDPFLPEPYDADHLEGKEAAKRELLDLIGPQTSADHLRRPLIAMISRMVGQKGLDLIAAAADRLPNLPANFVVLGTGEERYEDVWRNLAASYPDRVAAHIGFDERLAHVIEAAADIFLMPSRFEPCGLNQMYSMRYGTVPVVRSTGGLADTVADYNPRTGKGTGFVFAEYAPEALLGAVERALEAFRRPEIWRTLQRAGMRQDFSWDRSAREYVKLYKRALDSRSKGKGQRRT
jgi:starch synthase